MHHLTTSMLFCSFTIEACLNHLGEKMFLFWEPLKKKLNPGEKLDILSVALSFQPDFEKRPFQTFRSIFKFRNWLVHAKIEKLILEGDFLLD